jgi:hypothetical protein
MTEPQSLDEFLDKKQDYSPFLVHLTKDYELVWEDDTYTVPANDVLDRILSEKELIACNHFCLFSPNLKKQKTDLQDKFRVVCFTETPIDQIHVLLTELGGRDFKPKPYGLVFKKEYISEKKGNHVFYVTKKIAKPLWQLYWPLCDEDVKQSSDEVCNLLALVTVCDERNDWHWEREWRIVGNFKFKLENIYCGFCPEEDIEYFERKYPPVKFISPNWSENKILAKGVGK